MGPFRQLQATEMGHTATEGLTPRLAIQVTTEFRMAVIQATGLPRTLMLAIREPMALHYILALAMDHQEVMGAMEQEAMAGQAATASEVAMEESMGLDTEGVTGLMVATGPTMDYKSDMGFNQVSIKSQRKLFMIG